MANDHLLYVKRRIFTLKRAGDNFAIADSISGRTFPSREAVDTFQVTNSITIGMALALPDSIARSDFLSAKKITLIAMLDTMDVSDSETISSENYPLC